MGNIELDKNGYIRNTPEHSTLLHRKIAYHEIYKKNRSKYPLPFSKYVIHHIDKNKLNNSVDNLQILTKEEHDKVHNLTSSDTKKKAFWFFLASCVFAVLAASHTQGTEAIKGLFFLVIWIILLIIAIALAITDRIEK